MMKKICLAVLTGICSSGCYELVPDSSSVEVNIEDFEAVWNYIDSNYPLLEYKGLDWNEVYTKYRVRAEGTTGDDIYQVLHDLVGELQDGHASISTLGGFKIRPYIPYRKIRDANKLNVNAIRKYFKEPLLVIANDAIEYQFITETIGYVRISTFGDKLKGRQNEFADCIRYFKDAKGLIIDVRENNGGSSNVYDPIVGYLISNSILSGYQIRANEVIEPGVIIPNPNLSFTNAIVILINGTSFSAAEVFADRFWQLSHVTLVGDTTAGGGMSTNTDPIFSLPSGKSLSLNNSAVLRRDSIPIEWNGVPPNIYVKQTASDAISGIDNQLEFAIDFLKNKE